MEIIKSASDIEYTTIDRRIKMICVLLLILASSLLFIALAGCSEDDPNTPEQPYPTPVLNGISPQNGPKTTIVTIDGSNFGTNATKVQVFFNNLEAAVQSVTDTKITTVVPAKSYTGVVKVVIDGTTLTGPVFTYINIDVEVSTLAGNTTAGFANGVGSSANFDLPRGLTSDAQRNVYVADEDNHKIRKISPEGVVTTFAGSTQGFADGLGNIAQFDNPNDVAIDDEGNLYVADTNNKKIRKITPDGTVSTLAGSTGGYADGTGMTAQFSSLKGIVVDIIGNVYVTDYHRIRKITSNGLVSTLAGSTIGFADGIGEAAQFSFPTGITTDGEGNLYVADTQNNRIRKITINGAVVSTLAGGEQGLAEGTGANAKFFHPSDLTIDTAGNLYVVDSKNTRIRKVTPKGVVSSFAGTTAGYLDGPGATAKFSKPYGIGIDDLENLYVSDIGKNTIRKLVLD